MSGVIVPSAIEFRSVSCVRCDARVQDVDLSFARHRMTSLRGGVGCGKDLLLRLAGLLEEPDAGDILLDGLPLAPLGAAARAEVQRRQFAYLYAAPFLLPQFTVIENMVMPMFRVLDSGPTEARHRAEELLSFAGVRTLEEERAGDLPVFEQRKIAFARALAIGPSILLVEDADADETSEQRREFTALLREACSRWSVTTIATVSSDWHGSSADAVFDVVAGQVARAPEELPRG